MKQENIKVFQKDIKRIDEEVKELFLLHHPEMRGMRLSRAFLVQKMIDFWMEA
jgi:hypothetical protein